uniref:Uncharacterized protein n=1 Tax=Rhizophora mucronata TaxID=61149 RepID=A0A2P2Q0U2_RHIMU
MSAELQIWKPNKKINNLLSTLHIQL